MGQLTNQYVSQSFQGLLNLDNPFTGVTNTLQYVTDGIGNKLPMLASTSSIVITGSFRGDGSGLTGVTTTLPSGLVSGSVQIVDLGFATTSSLNTLSGSIAVTDLAQNNRLTSIESITGSLATTGSLNSYTLTSSFNSYTSSANGRLSSLESATSSLQNQINEKLDTGSFNSYTSSNDTKVNSLINATGSYATTGSNNFVGQQNINGSVNVTGSLNVTGEITALSASITYLETVYETASVIYSSGSNQFGDASNDTQTLFGTVVLPNGPLVVTGSVTATSFTGSLQGTASYSTNALSSSHSEYSDDAGLLNGTGSGVFATTGSNNFVGQQNINGSVNVTGSLLISGSQLQVQTNNGIQVTNPADNTSYYNVQIETGSFKKIAMNLYAEKSFIQGSGDLLFFNTWDANSSGSISFLSPNQINFTATSSVNISGSNNVDIKSSTISATGSLQVSGSNHKIIGDTTITGSLNVSGSTHSIIGNLGLSGSLTVSGSETLRGNLQMFSSPSTLNATVQPGQFITQSSPVSQSNVIFATTTTATSQGSLLGTQTGSILLSGSNNILFQSNRANTLVTAGTLGYIGGNSNIINNIPTITTSSLLSPTVANNNLNNPVNFAFTTSSLAAPNLSNNLIFGTTNINHQSSSVSFTNNIVGIQVTSNANVTTLDTIPTIGTNAIIGSLLTLNHNSSSINYSQNVGAINVTNNYSSSISTAVNNISVSQNFAGGSNQQLFVSGSNSGTRRTFNSNFLMGRANIVNSFHSGSPFTGGHLVSTALIGQELIVSASNTSTTIGGSTFVGRYNATGSLQESSQDAVFVVGTGTGAGSRRNALHIDSNNNTRITGSVNISGSFSSIGNVNITGSLLASGSNHTITGSVNITGSLSVNNQQITAVDTGSFATTGSNNFVGQQNIAGNVNVTGSLNVSGSIDLNNNGQSRISNNQTGRNVLYVDNDFSNFFFGNVPKVLNRFSGDTNNFILSPTFSDFQTGSQNLIFAINNSFFQSGSNNVFIGDGQPFGTAVNNSLYIGVNGSSVIQKGNGQPIQLAHSTQVTGSLDVSGSLNVNGGVLNPNALSVTGGMFISSSAETALNVTGALKSIGKTFFSSSDSFPLYVSGTIQTQRLHFDGNPFNTNPSSNLGAIRIDGNNQTFYSTMYDLAQITTQSLVGQTVITGSNLVKTTLQSSNAGTDAYVDLINNAGTRTLDIKVDETVITGSLIASGSQHRLVGPTTITGSLNVSGDVMFASGSNKTIGTVVLNGGNPATASVSNSLVTANSLIFLTKQTFTNHASVSVSSKGSGTFSIESSHNGDADTVGFLIINPS